MRRAEIRLLIIFIIICSFFFSIKQVSANTINNINMDVYLDSNGNASITEVWNAYLDQGTEGYRPYKLQSLSDVSNFSVSDDTGRIYDNLDYWNTSASFDSKAYKSGINNITDGVELCWGISNYGSRTYTLKYNISYFVTQYTDTQGIYFNFLNLDQAVENAKITIHSDIPFSLDNSRIWAFGNNGSINFENGNIILESGGKLSSNQYMVGLVRFENNIFNIDTKSSISFDDIYDSAFNKANKENKKDNIISKLMKLYYYLLVFVMCITIFNPIFWIVYLINKPKLKNWRYGTGKTNGTLNFGIKGKTLPNDNEINYWREIPCNKDLERAYWVCYQYNVVPERTLKQGIIGAILLKWIKNGYITVSQTKKGLLSIKDNNYVIDFRKMNYVDSEIENSLFSMLLSSSGNNKILESKEFAKWCKKNYFEINSWFLSIISQEQSVLESQGLITNSNEDTTGAFGRNKTITVKNVNSKLREDAIELKGLKKFLLDFSLMPEREYYEVHIWEEYLIFAQLMGIADKVEEQFSRLYPKFNQETLLNSEITIIAVRSIAEICYEGVQSGIEKSTHRSSYSSSSRDYSGIDRDSGGGGSSYDSGGSSSSGSSGGGFR